MSVHSSGEVGKFIYLATNSSSMNVIMLHFTWLPLKAAVEICV